MRRSHFLHTISAAMVIFIFIGCQNNKEENWELRSPDGKVKLSLSLQSDEHQNNSLVYKVEIIDDNISSPVIETSPLGINRKDQQFSKNLTLLSKSEIKVIDETYNMSIGRQSEYRNNANELALVFNNENGAEVQLVLRAYNDGVAFKYVFPEISDELFTVTKELTGFKIPENGNAWIEAYDVPSQWTPAYEKYYENGIPIGTSSTNEEGWAFPALFHSNGHWVLITEANLHPNYCGIRLEQDAPNGLYTVRFPDPRDAEGVGEVEPTSVLPWEMPWRTIIIGSSPASIIESGMIYNLSDAAIPGDFSWVKPGRASWSWLSDPDSPKDFDKLKGFVDLAVEMNWEYSLVDANWDLMKGGDIEQLVNYANSKNIGILMWYNSGGPHNRVTERPRDIISDSEKRKAEFKKLKEWGVKGVKIDFWHSDKQNLITLYHDVLVDAAEHQIMINFHGCTIPRGWSRTYPHLISMESVRGEECYLFDKVYTTEAPIQNSILPFTRNAIGPMDYTPFGLSDLENPHITSFSHELALTVIFNSGIIHFADNVKTYLSLPEYVREFVENVPAAFDETHYISGEPGKDVILACRKGNDWYLAGINSEKTIKELSIQMPFITQGAYDMSLIVDGANTRTFDNELKVFKAGDEIKVKMLEIGGFVAVLKAQ